MSSLTILGNTTGAVYLGVCLSSIIYGVTWLQAYLYYTQYSSRDGPILKTIVAAVMTLDTIHVAFVALAGYHYSVFSFGDYNVVTRPYWTMIWEVFLGGLLSILVNLFFAHRTWRLSKLVHPPGIILGLIAAKFACIVGFVARAAKVKGSWDDALTGAWPWNISTLSLSIFCDFIIALSTIYYLWRGRSGFIRTNLAINHLITYTLKTCALTCVFNILSLAFWVREDSNLIYTIFYFIVIRLYACTFLSIINSREVVRRELQGGVEGQVLALSSFTPIPSSARTPSYPDIDSPRTGTGLRTLDIEVKQDVNIWRM